LGVSHQHYYDIKRAIEEEGLEGLLEKSWMMPRIGNRVAPEIEQKLLDYSLEFPTHGQTRVASELKKQGIMISPGGVRSVWLRHNLHLKRLHLQRLEKWAADKGEVLPESQVKALEEAKEAKEAHRDIESHHPGFLLAQDTCYVGTIKGVGRIYQQTAIDTHCNMGFVKLYGERISLATADFLNDKVLRFFDEHGIRMHRVVTQNGSEFCGRKEWHSYELFLYLNDIEHTRTMVRRPQTNGAVERLNQTIQDDFYSVAFRKKLYRTIEEIQEDLYAFLDYYERQRTNQGRYCQGRTLYETFVAGLELYQKYVFENGVEESMAV